MKVIGKNVAIKAIEEEVETSGILLSGYDVKEMRYAKGKIIQAGTDVENLNPEDIIYYDTRQSYTLLVSGDKVTMIQERDVVVVL